MDRPEQAVTSPPPEPETEGTASPDEPETEGTASPDDALDRERAPAVPPWRRDAADLVLLFVVSRVALTAIGLVSRAMVPGPVWHPRPLGVGPRFSGFSFLDVWGEWDTSWYLSIARFGYRPVPLEGPFANYGFFPLYPLLSRWVGWCVGSPFLGGLILSNAAFVLACVFLYRLICLDDDVDTARRAVTYVFAAPAGFLFSAMLTESLYLALVVMCFYYARTSRWRAVGVLGFLLALSRGPGLFAAVPLAWIYLEQRNFSLRRMRPDVLWLGLFPAGVGLFMWSSRQLTGDALAFTHIQVRAWGHRLGNPVAALWGGLGHEDPVRSFPAWYMTGVVALTLAFLRRFGVAYALFVVISVVMPLAYGVPWGAMIRVSVVIFPFYVVAARFTRDRPGLDRAVVIASALLQGFLMSQWANNSLLVF